MNVRSVYKRSNSFKGSTEQMFKGSEYEEWKRVVNDHRKDRPGSRRFGRDKVNKQFAFHDYNATGRVDDSAYSAGGGDMDDGQSEDNKHPAQKQSELQSLFPSNAGMNP
eukprot:CAMPEP_0170483206 /NCGR_PEP_ID=MMETSP0208-20121228/2925_1 /TAXON_ID=197538 /ORGANISM="Strombidium inclinatum, Strain S3" /LENGTH=108 /DNA_ID=CAMNT_0010756155 /DNA_START=1753 /DNA_END=2079 /DNA_ORIENTATION=-